MTYEEAVKVCGIIESADGECYVCAGRLLALMMAEFKGIDWKKAYLEANPDGQNSVEVAENEQ